MRCRARSWLEAGGGLDAYNLYDEVFLVLALQALSWVAYDEDPGFYWFVFLA